MVKKYSKAFLVIFLTALMFIGLYHFDNKYNDDALQASNGLLFISKNDIEMNPVRFLSRGWSFYPNVLLTPADFNNGDPDLYVKDVNIGEQTTFNPYGKGTYVLRINLPQKDIYGLDIPEIFSAYHLFINDEELISIGNPDQNNYEAKTANRMVTFEQSGTITIIIAVSNYSHFYSGIVYPPAFGTPLGLNYTRGIHLGINLIGITIIVIIALLSLYFSLVRKQKNSLLFTLLCITSIGFISYPVIHSLFVTSILPWYTLEVLSNYLAMLLIIILHNRLCYINQKISTTSITIGAVFCLFTLLYCLNSNNLNMEIIKLFSNSVYIFKIILVIYLLVTSYLTIKNNNDYIKPLFYSDIFFAGACLWDRIYPNYEPIYGFRFIEWGSIILIFSIGFLLWKNIIETYAHNLSFIEEHRQMTRQLALQMEYSNQIKEVVDENRQLIHDFRQHLRVINNMAKQTQQNMISEYLKDVYKFIDNSKPIDIIVCNNSAINALLQYYLNICRIQKIELKIKLSIPDTLTLSDVELCSIFGNLLENAVEACQRQTSQNKYIFITSKESDGLLYLVFENSYDDRIIQLGHQFLSSKTTFKRLGIGLQSVKKTITNHQGTIDIYFNKNLFRVGIVLPLQ